MGFLDMLRPKFGKDDRKAPPPKASQPKTATPTPAPQSNVSIPFVPHRTYTVKTGDTLSKIAKAELGDATKYMAIYDMNRDLLKDPDKIYPGQVLKIPDTSRTH